MLQVNPRHAAADNINMAELMRNISVC